MSVEVANLLLDTAAVVTARSLGYLKSASEVTPSTWPLRRRFRKHARDTSAADMESPMRKLPHTPASSLCNKDEHPPVSENKPRRTDLR